MNELENIELIPFDENTYNDLMHWFILYPQNLQDLITWLNLNDEQKNQQHNEVIPKKSRKVRKKLRRSKRTKKLKNQSRKQKATSTKKAK